MVAPCDVNQPINYDLAIAEIICSAYGWKQETKKTGSITIIIQKSTHSTTRPIACRGPPRLKAGYIARRNSENIP